MFYALFNTKIEFRITIVYFEYNMTCFKQCFFRSVFPFHVLVTPSKGNVQVVTLHSYHGIPEQRNTFIS